VFHCTTLVHTTNSINDVGVAPGTTSIATVGFSDLHYHELHPLVTVNELSREQLIKHAQEEWKAEQVLLYTKCDDYLSYSLTGQRGL
jgi:hypothetical protein